MTDLQDQIKLSQIAPLFPTSEFLSRTSSVSKQLSCGHPTQFEFRKSFSLSRHVKSPTPIYVLMLSVGDQGTPKRCSGSQGTLSGKTLPRKPAFKCVSLKMKYCLGRVMSRITRSIPMVLGGPHYTRDQSAPLYYSLPLPQQPHLHVYPAHLKCYFPEEAA